MHHSLKRITYSGQVDDPEDAIQTERTESDSELVHVVAVSGDCAACAPRLGERSADVESA